MFFMKKLLLISQKYSLFTEPLRRTFTEFGWAVSFLDYWGTPILMPYTLRHRIAAKLPVRIKEKIIQRELMKVDNEILRTARSLKPDLILVSKGKSISPAVLDELKQICVTANWYSETMDHWERISRTAPHYTHFFSFDPVVVQRLNERGYASAHYLPFCADIPKNAQFPEGKVFRNNITFVGSFEKTRYARRETLLSAVKDLGLSIWGNKAWRQTSLKECYRRFVPREQLFDLYRESKVVLGMHVFGVAGSGTTNRPFDVTGAGAFLLNQDERRDIFNLFRDGQEFISFHDEHDLRKKVEYYLAHDDERETIARAGFERTRRDHTYLDRVQKVLHIIGL